MKYIKNIIAVGLLVGICNITYSAELSVDEIQVLDANTLSVMLSENPDLEEGDVEWEVRVLNDIKLRWAFPSESDTNTVELLLEDPMLPNTTYSLLTVLGADWSIDFTTPETLEWYTASNVGNVESQDIDQIEILDDRTVIVRYRDAITSSNIEFKLLAESDVVSIQKPDFYTAEIIISIEPPFISNKDYILMFIEMQDASDTFLEFDTGIYDFKTSTIEEVVTKKDVIEEVPEVLEEPRQEVLEVMELDIPSNDEEMISNGDIELEAAGSYVWLEKETEMIGTNQAASMVTQTPDAGAETWAIVVATIVINSFYYLSRRKKAVLAV